jgi:hypothetical protein
MINEGIIAGDARAMVKSEMIKQLKQLGPTDPDTWERAVFKSMVGHEREDVDWEFEDNQAGYFTWIKSFDQLVGELLDDGYVQVEQAAGSRYRYLAPTETDGSIDYSQIIHSR